MQVTTPTQASKIQRQWHLVDVKDKILGRALWQLRAENPIEIIRRAVMGMLPKNKLRARMITRLHIEPEADHTFQSKFLSNA